MIDMSKQLKSSLFYVFAAAALGYVAGCLLAAPSSEQEPASSAAPRLERSSKDAAKAIKLLRKSDRECSLKDAVLNGNVRVTLKHLKYHSRLSDKIERNKLDIKGHSLLHMAAMAGHADIVYLLVHHGSDATIPAKDGRKPYAMARDRATRQACRFGERLRQMEIDTFIAAREGRDEDVFKGLRSGVDPNPVMPDDPKVRYNPLLMEVVPKCSPRVMQVLIESGADVNVNEISRPVNVLFHAVVENRTDLIPLLIKAGANPFHKNWMNASYIIYDAIWNNKPETLKQIIDLYKETVGLDIYSPNLGYPITLAIERDRFECLDMLLSAGVDPNNPIYSDNPLLIRAVQVNDARMVERLLQAGADKNARDKKGKRAIDYAKGDAVAKLLR